MERSSEFLVALKQGDFLGQRDWGLQRKGPIDQARHNQKVKEAIRHNPGEVLSNEEIITSDGTKRLRIPIRSLDLPDFRYGITRPHIGTGQGEIGDVVAEGKEQGVGKKAGNEPGDDFYEAELSVNEVLELVFAGLGLPNLEDRGNESIQKEKTIWDEVRRSGPMSNLAKRRTLLASLQRNAILGKGTVVKIDNEDLRFKSWNTVPDIDRSAVVIAMRDVSGSMGDFERFVTRVSCAWMVRFLRKRYQNVEMVFIAHHATAKEVDEANFFQYGESGGTIISTAYQLAVDIMRQRYPWQSWNIYPFHFSDGLNWVADDKKCAALVRTMINENHCNLFGYTEIREPSWWEYVRSNPDWKPETLKKELDALGDPKVVTEIVSEDADIGKALRRFFRTEGVEGAVSKR